MNLEEYEKWLEENGYNEEANAIGVVNEILRYHMKSDDYQDVQLYPHHIIKQGNNRFEFDLVIHLIHKHEAFSKWIGVEFKEGDVEGCKTGCGEKGVRRLHVYRYQMGSS